MLTINFVPNKFLETDMSDDIREKITGFGEVVADGTVYRKIYYKVIVEKEDANDDEPDIYGTLKDKRGDKLDLTTFVGSSGDIFLHLDDERYLQIVFLDDSGQFEVIGGFRKEP
jgi:hypothetical protein